MSSHDGIDPVLDALRGLRDYDVSAARAGRLRARCHTALERQSGHTPTSARRAPSRSERVVHLLAGAWCCVYLFETIRLAAAVYGLG